MKRLLLLALCACAAPPPPPGSAGPAEAVQEFASAVQKGDASTAWAFCGPPPPPINPAGWKPKRYEDETCCESNCLREEISFVSNSMSS